jgi:lipopolysaccharide export system permease protein
MQILARYIAAALIKNLTLSLLGLTGLFFFQKIITQLNDYSLNQLLIYNFYDLPSMMVVVAPPAALMATVLTLSALSKTNELVACHSIGISLNQIVSVIVPIVFVMCCFSLVVQDRILPAFYEKKSLFYWREIKKQQDFFLDVKQDKIWYRSNNLIYHIRTFDPKLDRILGIGVYVFNEDFTLKELLQAEVATYNGTDWELTQGKSTRFNDKSGFPLTEPFKSRSLKIKESPKDFKEIEKEVDRLRIKDLIRFISNSKKSGIDSKIFETKLHSRFSLSFIPLIMCLLAVPFSTSRSREGRLGRDLAIAFGITFFYWLGFSISVSLGQNGTLPPVVAAWAPSVIFGILALVLLKRMQKQ